MPLTRNGQFWLLHLGGWSAWMVLFATYELYEGAQWSSVLVYPVLAAAGLVLSYPLRWLYGLLWDHGLTVRVIAVIVAVLNCPLARRYGRRRRLGLNDDGPASRRILKVPVHPLWPARLYWIGALRFEKSETACRA